MSLSQALSAISGEKRNLPVLLRFLFFSILIFALPLGGFFFIKRNVQLEKSPKVLRSFGITENNYAVTLAGLVAVLLINIVSGFFVVLALKDHAEELEKNKLNTTTRTPTNASVSLNQEATTEESSQITTGHEQDKKDD